MQLQTIQTYKFSELSDAAKEKALEGFRDCNVDFGDWWDYVYQDWQEKLAREGYNEVDISFTGFWSQGDGANFTATIDIEKWLKVAKKAGKYRALYNFSKQYDIPTKIVRAYTWHYEHEMTTDIDTSDCYDMSDKVEKQLLAVEALLLEEARDYMRDIYKDLEKNYEYLVSDEAVTETIELNEYDFLENGETTLRV